EEFTLLLPETDVEGVRHLAERMRHKIDSTRFRIGDTVIHYTISLGYTCLDFSYLTAHPGSTPEKNLVKYADKALYRAKENGKNRAEAGELFCDIQ
ncbi:MAG: GGDEF domain-containing protein, partial [Fibrobacterota bacterium]